MRGLRLGMGTLLGVTAYVGVGCQFPSYRQHTTCALPLGATLPSGSDATVTTLKASESFVERHAPFANGDVQRYSRDERRARLPRIYRLAGSMKVLTRAA